MEKTLYEQLVELLNQAGLENYEIENNNGKISLYVEEPKDETKENFEAFVQELDDEFFGEVLEELSEKYPLIEKAYSENTEKMIADFMEYAKKIALDKIETLKYYLSLIQSDRL